MAKLRTSRGSTRRPWTNFGLVLQNASTPRQMAACTACRANPLYNDSLVDRRTDHVFLRGLTLDDVASMDLAYNDRNVVVTPSAATRGQSLVPVLDHRIRPAGAGAAGALSRPPGAPRAAQGPQQRKPTLSLLLPRGSGCWPRSSSPSG